MSLTDKELAQLSKCIPPTCSIMASGIARLFLSSPNPKANKRDPTSIFASFPYLNAEVWSDTNVQGAVLLVVDRTQDAVLIQIFDLDSGLQRRFEYELYYDFEYLSLDPNFHAFEMEDCVAGLCFSSKEVAKKFAAKVRALTPDSADLKSTVKKKGLFGFGFGGGKDEGKIEISNVVNVVHQQHVGMNPDGTFDLGQLSPEWKSFFKQAGIKKTDLKNPETAKAVMQSIQMSGYSLAAAPGKYVQASHVAPVAGPVAAKKGQALPQVKEKEHHTYSKQELEKAYNAEQIKAYEDYQRQLAEYEKAQKQYEEELAEYERQMALMDWEKNNAQFIQEHEKERRMSTADKFKQPPPLPPRTKKKDEASLSRTGSVETNLKVTAHVEMDLPPPPPAPAASVTAPAKKEPPPLQPRPPPTPAAPPPLPDLPNGINPMKELEKQLNSVKLQAAPRPTSRLFLAAIAGSTTALKPVDKNPPPPVKRTDVTQTENLAALLAATMAQRRVQLTAGGNPDSDDDWSD